MAGSIGPRPSPRIDHYDWAGGREAMLRFGPDDGPLAIVALPLFEEANRTRTFAMTLLRALADRGIAGVLPDVPGQGESLVPLASMTILQMQTAYEEVVFAHPGRRCYAIGLRSGALLDTFGLLFGRWYLAPQGGPALLRELGRIRQAAVGKPLAEDWFFHDDGPFEIAGNSLSAYLLTELIVKEPYEYAEVPRRTVRLASDLATADLKVDAAPIWRRAEPDNDPVLATLLADDIAQWIGSFA